MNFYFYGTFRDLNACLSFPLVCNKMETSPAEKPFQCLDLTYISVLLQELGFPKDKVFKVRAQLKNDKPIVVGCTLRWCQFTLSLHQSELFASVDYNSMVSVYIFFFSFFVLAACEDY